MLVQSLAPHSVAQLKNKVDYRHALQQALQVAGTVEGQNIGGVDWGSSLAIGQPNIFVKILLGSLLSRINIMAYFRF